MFHVKRFLFIFLLFPLVSVSQNIGSVRLEVKAAPILPLRSVVIEEYLNSFSDFGNLSNAQKEWFYWTNYSRLNPRLFWDSVISPLLKAHPQLNSSYSSSLKRDLHNAQPLPLVRPSKSLESAAKRLARELAAKQAAPSHTSPSGVTFEDRMKGAGIKNCAGENISFGSDNTVLMLALLYIDQGVPNLGHRKSLLNPDHVEMGIGVEEYPSGQYLVIQDFSCNQAQ